MINKKNSEINYAIKPNFSRKFSTDHLIVVTVVTVVIVVTVLTVVISDQISFKPNESSTKSLFSPKIKIQQKTFFTKQLF